MVSEKNALFLSAMALVEDISVTIGTTSYIWGGLTLDVYNGRFLREHHDLDYLTENLKFWRTQFIESFEAEGWEGQKLGNGDLRFIKDDIRVHLGNIQIADVVTWTHNGEKGSLSFPVDWLNWECEDFLGTQIHLVQPEFEYVIKHFPELLNPDWKPREKDLMARKQLQAMIMEKGVELNNLLNKIGE